MGHESDVISLDPILAAEAATQSALANVYESRYFGNTERQKITSPDNPLYQFKDSRLIVFTGGNKQTCFFKTDTNDSCWAVVGVGIKPIENSYEVLSQSEWSNYLAADKVNLKPVNGHFVAIKYYDNELKFFTDELGLRDIHIVQLPDGFGFTTRIDWLKYFIKPEIDLTEFGSRWLLQNRVSTKSIIKNVTRLVCANVTIKENSLSIEQNEWLPNFEMPCNLEIFNSILHQILSIREKNSKPRFAPRISLSVPHVRCWAAQQISEILHVLQR